MSERAIRLPSNPTIADIITALQEYPPDWLFYLDADGIIAPPGTLCASGTEREPMVVME
jgi:hypothetical protein